MSETEYQLHWHPEEICEDISGTPDTAFIFGWWDSMVRNSASVGPPGRVLDVACGNARDITFLSSLGWEGWGLDPSPLQLRDAARSARDSGQRLNVVQGIAERLPFKPGVFDSLICKSALDHLVDRDRAMREFAESLRPEGRAVISINNYRSVGTRFSRLLYRIRRAFVPSARSERYHWDSPVPFQHMYECDFDNTQALGKPYFATVERYGVSLLWGVPGWGRLLSLLPQGPRLLVLRFLNRVARPLPRLADVIVFVWRPNAGVSRGST